MKWTLLVDESGDTGISKVRTSTSPGSNPYLVLGAVLIPDRNLSFAQKKLSSIEAKLGRSWKHATDLNHFQTVYACRETSKLQARFFGLFSNKDTLSEYKDEIKADPQKFYNKCVVYLLERVGMYLSTFSLNCEDHSIVLEKRNHDYDRMIRYLEKCKNNPFYPQAKSLKNINPFSIVAKSKNDEPLLRFADLVSFSLFQCVNVSKSNFEIPETKYLVELSDKFACDKTGRIRGVGFKYIHSFNQIKFLPEVKAVIQALRATAPKTK